MAAPQPDKTSALAQARQHIPGFDEMTKETQALFLKFYEVSEQVETLTAETKAMLLAAQASAPVRSSSKFLPSQEKVARGRKVAQRVWIADKQQPESAESLAVKRKAQLTARGERLKSKQQADREAAELQAQQIGLPAKKVFADGGAISLVRFRNGIPLYNGTDNLNAADTISTDEIWPGGTTQYDLDGTNTTIGIWEVGGGVYSTHNEFTDLGPSRVTQIDSPGSIAQHATWVAGTLIAGGVNPSANGMSWRANLSAYNHIDDFGEMTVAAANDELIISNHSYSLRAGWEFIPGLVAETPWFWLGDTAISQSDDFKFGFYQEEPQSIDQVVYLSQTYLPIWSAGNHRDASGQGPPPGSLHVIFIEGSGFFSTTSRPADGGATGFETLPPQAIAKNNLVIGSVGDIAGGYTSPQDVILSSFTSLGPTDDGRIKPDLVANGDNVFTSDTASVSSYATVSGTSFSAPNVTGSLNLIQQLHKEDVSDTPMLASTLRGIAIHTADDAGNPGPDYRFGWGLLNSVSAGEVVVANSVSETEVSHIKEVELPHGEFIEFPVIAAGNEQLRVTICWTDPPYSDSNGDVLPDSLDPTTLMLVNDLDLRVTPPTGSDFHPFVLNPAAPDSNAFTGDNTRDNVEQVVITSPVADGEYIIKITHKGNLEVPVLIQSGEPGFDPTIDKYILVNTSDANQFVSIIITGNKADKKRFFKAENLALLPNDEFFLDWPSEVGKRYKVQISDDLLSAFTDVTSDFSALRTTTELTVPYSSPLDKKFFRVVETK